MRLAACSVGTLLVLFTMGTSGTPVGPKPLEACEARQGEPTCDERFAIRMHHVDAVAKRIAHLQELQAQRPSDQIADAIARAEAQYQALVAAAVTEFCDACPDRC